MNKRIVLFATAFLAAALIVGATWQYRQQNEVITNSEMPLLEFVLTPSAVPTGQLAEAVQVPFPDGGTAVIDHPFFPLTAAHANISCSGCHGSGVFEGLGTNCIDCHADDDVHNGANGTDCAQCHTPTRWQDATFDHSLIGQRDCAECHSPPPNHFPAPCTTCHLDTTNFFNVNFDHTFIGNQDCSACHSPPPNHFPGACSSCHTDTTNFRNANFSHPFPLNHGGANGQCTTCHVGNDTAVYTCNACHNPQEMEEEHADKDIFNISNCVACHADGEEPDDDDFDDDDDDDD